MSDPTFDAPARTRAAFAVEVSPHPRQPRQCVLHPGQFDLEPCFPGLGALGENIENHFLAVDHTKVGESFPFALLGWGEAVIDHDHIAFVGAGQLDHFHRLAGAAEEFFVHFPAFGQQFSEQAPSQA